MSLPYETATSGTRAIDDMQKILQEFGCRSLGHMMNFERGELLVQFEYRDRQVSVKASAKGYAAAWLQRNPYKPRMRTSRVDYEKKALQLGATAVYSIIRDWLKGQIMAVETGVLSFDGAFLGQLMLPTGMTVLDRMYAPGGLLEPPK